MIKKIILAILCTSIVVAWSALCKTPQVDVRAKTFAVLEQFQDEGARRSDDWVIQMDIRISDLEEREIQLKQLLPQAEPWIERKKLDEYDDVPCG
ncbi:hypothetical protein ACFLXL_01395 [Chloroflexota bacterium]